MCLFPVTLARICAEMVNFALSKYVTVLPRFGVRFSTACNRFAWNRSDSTILTIAYPPQALRGYSQNVLSANCRVGEVNLLKSYKALPNPIVLRFLQTPKNAYIEYQVQLLSLVLPQDPLCNAVAAITVQSLSNQIKSISQSTLHQSLSPASLSLCPISLQLTHLKFLRMSLIRENSHRRKGPGWLLRRLPLKRLLPKQRNVRGLQIWVVHHTVNLLHKGAFHI